MARQGELLAAGSGEAGVIGDHAGQEIQLGLTIDHAFRLIDDRRQNGNEARIRLRDIRLDRKRRDQLGIVHLSTVTLKSSTPNSLSFCSMVMTIV